MNLNKDQLETFFSEIVLPDIRLFCEEYGSKELCSFMSENVPGEVILDQEDPGAGLVLIKPKISVNMGVLRYLGPFNRWNRGDINEYEGRFYTYSLEPGDLQQVPALRLLVVEADVPNNNIDEYRRTFPILGYEFQVYHYPVLFSKYVHDPSWTAEQVQRTADLWHEGSVVSAMQALESDLQHEENLYR